MVQNHAERDTTTSLLMASLIRAKGLDDERDAVCDEQLRESAGRHRISWSR